MAAASRKVTERVVGDVQSLRVGMQTATLGLGGDRDREREPLPVPAGLEALGELQVVRGVREVAAPAARHEQAPLRTRATLNGCLLSRATSRALRRATVVSRTTMTWSGALEKTSRVKVVSPIR